MAGTRKYWIDGRPLGTILTSDDAGPRKYWIDGLPLSSVGTSSGTSIESGDGTSAGVGDADAVGVAIAQTVGTAAGTSTANAVGLDANSAGNTVGTAAGTSTAAGVGNAIAQAAGSAAGSATATGVGAATGVVEGVGTAAGVATVTGVSNVVEGVGTAAGTSTAVAEGSFLTGAVGTAAGTSTATAVGASRLGAIAVGAFTYEPVAGVSGTFSARRRPEFRISRNMGDAPDTCTYSTPVEVDTGEDIDCDFGEGSRFKGLVQSFELEYEERAEQTVRNVTLTDYQWLLNRRRPFGCYENTSATTVVTALMTNYTTGFTYTNLEDNLPAVSVTFDGSEAMSEALTRIAQLIGARWRLDEKNLFFKIVADATNPTDITDSTMDTVLLKEPGIRMVKDLSQVRNRVFGRGASLRCAEYTPAGQTFMWVEGADIFNIGTPGQSRTTLTGGTMIVDCQRFTYSGVEAILVPDDRGTAPSAPIPALTGGGASGNIRNPVRYKGSLVREDGESYLSTNVNGPSNTSTVDPTMNAPTSGGECTGSVPLGSKTYVLAWVLDDGGFVFNRATAGNAFTVTSEGSTEFTGMSTTPTRESGGTDTRVVAKALLRTKVGALDGPLYVVDDNIALAATTYVDVLDDTSLGTTVEDDYQDAGYSVTLTGLVTPDDRLAYKLYRSDYINGEWTSYKLLVTIDDEDTGFFLDDYASPTGDDEPESTSTLKMRLFGINGLTRRVKEGATVSLWEEEEDVQSQADLAAIEGGDGVHEYEVPGLSGYTSAAELRQRLQAELELFKDPIVTVSYATRDRETKPGRTVFINLTNPPIGPVTLKIQSVTVDQVHEAEGLIERYNVTASSVRFTLDDLLRRALIR